MKTTPTLPRRAAFSLLELLVVCSIIAVVVGLTVPAVGTLIRGSQLTQGAQLITDQMSLARQYALSKGRRVEVRFYKFGDAEVPGEDKTNSDKGKYRAFQLFDVFDSGASVPINRIQRLPAMVVFNESPQLSTLIGSRTKTKADLARNTDPSIPELPREVGLNYEYVAFRFLPNGSADLSLTAAPALGKWYVTLHGIDRDPKTTFKVVDDKGLPLFNFFTLQVDPVSGIARTYRPNAG